jgi:hypothetical protein
MELRLPNTSDQQHTVINMFLCVLEQRRIHFDFSNSFFSCLPQKRMKKSSYFLDLPWVVNFEYSLFIYFNSFFKSFFCSIWLICMFFYLPPFFNPILFFERSILLQVSKRLQFWKLPGSKLFNNDNFAFLIHIWFFVFLSKTCNLKSFTTPLCQNFQIPTFYTTSRHICRGWSIFLECDNFNQMSIKVTH